MPRPSIARLRVSASNAGRASPGGIRALLLAVLLLAGAPGWAAETSAPAGVPGPARMVLDAAQVWDFAESLYGQGEYYRAVSEYQRLVYYFPQSVQAPLARVRMGEAFLLGGEPAQALRQFDALLSAPEPQGRDGLLYRRGLAWLERDAGRPYSLRLESIDAGLRDFHDVTPGSPEEGKVAPFLAAMEQPHDVPSRSPWLAGSLSAVIPGAGSVYAGRYAEGGLAFFVNALLISAAVTAFHHDQPALGGVLGVFALAFYGGSIYAAVNGAHKFNDRAQAAYLDEQRTRFGILLVPGGAGATLQRNF